MLVDVSALVTENLDIWSSTIKAKNSQGRGSSKKTELYGVKKLRELILELAVRGLLVPQDPNDEPASVLLKKIGQEKWRLVEEKKIKKQRPLSKIEKSEEPFKLPSGWMWTRLGDLVEMYNGRAFKSHEWRESGGLPIVRIQNLNNQDLSFNYFEGELSEHHRINDNSFLISWSGTPGTSFGAFIWRRGEAALNQHINNCIFHIEHINLEFMRLAVNGCMNHFISMAQGGVGLKHVTKGTLNNAIIGFPPEDEQNRIVTKVNELMTLCDRLEQQQETSISAHQTLVESLLGTLVNAADATSFSAAWQRIAENFDVLFTTEHSIEQLKQTILQLAVMGKLVSFGERVQSKVVKDVLSFGPRNGLSPKEAAVETDRRVLKLGATSFGFLNLQQVKFVDIDIPEDSHLWLKAGDILVQRGNSSVFVGSNVLIEADVIHTIYPDLMMKLRANDSVEPEYLSLWMRAPESREYMWSRMTGTSGTMPKISKRVVEGVPISVPSINVQKAIVDKVNELMTLCDTLLDRIKAAQTTQLNLTDAITEQATA
ncbi:type I restriction enzyme S subunit [Alteromonadaceae bacterium 2753L.S.0a.02]|nr:type I restriction enzyme S subunit [Alteromonadaceae bacterium 2753L.S.0a.02]